VKGLENFEPVDAPSEIDVEQNGVKAQSIVRGEGLFRAVGHHDFIAIRHEPREIPEKRLVVVHNENTHPFAVHEVLAF